MTLRLRHFLCLCLIPALLSGCVGGMPLNSDKEKLFAELNKNGPKVDGVESTLLKGAIEMDKRGEFSKSTSIYQQLISIDASNVDYMLRYASGLRRTGKLEDSDAAYGQILKIAPKNIDAKEGRALVKLNLGEYDEAGRVLTEIYKKDKTRWRSINGLAILLAQRNLYADAIAYFKEAVKQSDNNVTVLNNLGITYALNENQQNAVQTLHQAIEKTESKTPMRRNLELNLALILGINGDMDLAEKILSEHLPASAVDNNLGLYAYLANDEKLAKSYLNTALSKSPYHYQRAWDNLATITEQSKGSSIKNMPTSKVLKVQ